VDPVLETVLFYSKSLLFEGGGVTANKETVNCSLGLVLAFPRLLKCGGSGVTVTNLSLK